MLLCFDNAISFDTKLSTFNFLCLICTISTDCETQSVPVGQFDHFEILLTHTASKRASIHPDAVVTLKPVSLTRVALAIHHDFCGHFILFTRFRRVKFTEVINITRTSSTGLSLTCGFHHQSRRSTVFIFKIILLILPLKRFRLSIFPPNH